MSKASQGNTVAFHYTGSLDDGTVFDSSQEGDPLRVTVGNGEIIPGVEQALEGMEPGEEKSVTINSDDAYGPHRPELVQEIERERIPPHVDLTVGNRLEGKDPSGRTLHLTVLETNDSTVKLDANHPLAGKDLKFDLKLVEIV